MSKRQIGQQARRLDQLVRSEARVHERLLALRDGVDLIAAVLDRVTVPRRRVRPEMMAGPDIAGIVSLSRFRERGRP